MSPRLSYIPAPPMNYNNAAPRPPRDEPVYAQPQRPSPIHYAPDTLEPIAAVEDEVDD